MISCKSCVSTCFPPSNLPATARILNLNSARKALLSLFSSSPTISTNSLSPGTSSFWSKICEVKSLPWSRSSLSRDCSLRSLCWRTSAEWHSMSSKASRCWFMRVMISCALGVIVEFGLDSSCFGSIVRDWATNGVLNLKWVEVFGIVKKWQNLGPSWGLRALVVSNVWSDLIVKLGANLLEGLRSESETGKLKISWRSGVSHMQYCSSCCCDKIYSDNIVWDVAQLFVANWG